MTVSMIANKRMYYGTRMLKAGDPFEANPGVARIYAKVGRARLAAPAKVEPVPVLKVPPHDGLVMARAEYERLFGKRPYMGWDEAMLREKISAAPTINEQRRALGLTPVPADTNFFKAD